MWDFEKILGERVDEVSFEVQFCQREFSEAESPGKEGRKRHATADHFHQFRLAPHEGRTLPLVGCVLRTYFYHLV